jgi:hypothetical protein
MGSTWINSKVRRIKMGQSVEAIEAMGKALGIPLLPPDHPEYLSGPQVHFVHLKSTRSKKKASAATTPIVKKSMTPLESKDNS